jgi:hypothetical protein
VPVPRCFLTCFIAAAIGVLDERKYFSQKNLKGKEATQKEHANQRKS